VARFVFELQLSGESVKRIVFATGRGRRRLLTSGGQPIGQVVLDEDGLHLSIDEASAHMLAEAQIDGASEIH
jgi:hypothetical protein